MATPALEPKVPAPAAVPAVPDAPPAGAPRIVSSQALTRCCASTGSCSYPSCKCDLPLAKAIQ